MKHELTCVNGPCRRGVCAICGPVDLYFKGWRKENGEWVRRYRCGPAARANMKGKRRMRRYLKGKCERCGFVPEHYAQLEIHHKDHDRTNNDPSNFETLCANCHKLHHVRSDAD